MIFKICLMAIIAYLLGSIPWGLWIGQVFYHKDIRKLGSGNIGTTNTLRVLGPKAGVTVLFLDMFKGTLAACQPYFFHCSQTVSPLLIGLFAVLGHTCSIFDHFHGGKAVATSAGILLAYNPLLFLVAWAIYLTVLLLTSMASAAGMVGITAIFIIALCIHDWTLAAIAGFLTVVIIWLHRANIKRIFNGTESLVHFGLGYRRQQKRNQK